MESEVRQIILDICGVAFHHRKRCPPALVNSAIAITLYGDFFTDQWERDALKSIIDDFSSVRAWPGPKALEAFK